MTPTEVDARALRDAVDRLAAVSPATLGVLIGSPLMCWSRLMRARDGEATAILVTVMRWAWHLRQWGEPRRADTYEAMCRRWVDHVLADYLAACEEAHATLPAPAAPVAEAEAVAVGEGGEEPTQ
jgi:hypothetical protein